MNEIKENKSQEKCVSVSIFSEEDEEDNEEFD